MQCSCLLTQTLQRISISIYTRPIVFFGGGGKPIHTNIRLLTLKDGEAEVMDAAIDVTSKAQHHAGLLVLSIRILHRDDGVLCAEIPLAELYAGVHFAVPVPIM